MSYRVRLNVFEGPFDLLVYLIEHAQMSIYDIRIAEITEQYVQYISRMQEADINVSTEFMVLAAELLEIKSKMLLPRSAPEEDATAEYEDPRTELVARLREYKLFKELSQMLEGRWEETAARLEKPQEDLTEFTGSRTSISPWIWISSGQPLSCSCSERRIWRRFGPTISGRKNSESPRSCGCGRSATSSGTAT